MTEIHHNSVVAHHSVDDASRHSENSLIGNGTTHGRQTLNDSTRGLLTGTINISFNAHMRLRAYQEQPNRDVMTSLNPPVEVLPSVTADTISPDIEVHGSEASGFSDRISGMLSEVHKNIVQASEPGYRYLVNMLNNYQTKVEDPQQLQEIMRKEEFYLTRRKPFMGSADFHSYSQVLNQFSNIVERQQYS